YYIIEYFDFYDNRPENFSKYVNDNISNKIIDQLIDFKTTKLKGVKYSKNRPIFNVYRIITKLLINRYRKFFLVKLIFLITLLYFKNLKLFFIKVATKGDFTERNILIKEDVVKFIDFDSYYDKGSWLQDATYLLLHQDVEIENLKWQKKFFVKYLQNVHLNFMRLNKDYIRFWLLLTSLQQFSIRYFQKQKNLVNIDSVLHKEQHIKYFLNKEKFNLFINKIGYNDQL
ncbi:MAG: hypothetical protein U9Q27_03625, partial [Patescibacteria group bacterium]|nr:hypothetical protein [Patescibacteria group bacterium]MEA3501067.1 hypothetical protein [Candidatus Neomarinimicrobiota bacterium]